MVDRKTGKIVQVATYITEDENKWIEDHMLSKSSLLRTLLRKYIATKQKEEKKKSI